MTIFPRNKHLKVCMYSSSLLGIWPFIFEENPTLRQLYQLYSNFMLVYYTFFIGTAYMKLAELLRADEIRMDDISANLCITLIYTITIIRQIMLRGKGVLKMIRYIIDTENKIYAAKDEKVIEAYDRCADLTIKLSKIYLAILFVITMSYFIHPLLEGGYFLQKGNETMLIRALPLSSWFPFDEQKYYWWAYAWHVVDACIGASFVTYTDILMFSMIVYPTGQLKILDYILRNFQFYEANVADGRGDDRASYLAFRECISKHRDIIAYVDDFNGSMQNLMIFDFLQSSLQIASILTQVFGNEITLVLLSFVGTFFVGMILRLILYYYFANEVLILSVGLAGAIWDSGWCVQTPRVKYMMVVFMQRAQKSLKLFIGPFGVMSLQAFLSILRATYSYIMLMYGIN
ncbi:uncharacterized protein LOC132704859 isoform X2 [Cylas formicarius]|uniref:uncharacterized protein LOC132704859 isoform X2 n=1 Tax=Cylas formicarius TaxID=197179 RepID=UPI0029584166|nr:uncharacterized protein LOC132704859 isoform X2 [Cylas formicarius]